jgi:putative tryptophan/tyrosine transport system ATP-binding protein
VLELIGVRKTFNPGTPNQVRALDGVDLVVEAGAFVVVIGTKGSGKSSLLNAIAGNFALDSGRIEVDGHDVTRWAEPRRAGLIGRVFHSPFSGTFADLSIAENLALAARRGLHRGLRPALGAKLLWQMREAVRQLDMGLENRLDQPAGSLPGGQRQALTLLMAVWREPKLLLLDEHTAALDPKSAEQVTALSSRFIARGHLTTLMATHSMQQAAKLGDRLIMMHRGKVLFDLRGSEKKRIRPEELLERFEELRRAELLDESAAEMLRAYYV